jgi:hypothetical protein
LVRCANTGEELLRNLECGVVGCNMSVGYSTVPWFLKPDANYRKSQVVCGKGVRGFVAGSDSPKPGIRARA